MTNSCPTCGHLVPASSRFCPTCGTPLGSDVGLANTGQTISLGPRCHQPIGLLVPHRCGLPAQSSCRVCGMPYCDAHLSIDLQGPICASCASGGSTGSTTSHYSDSDLDYFDRVSENERGEDFADLS